MKASWNLTDRSATGPPTQVTISYLDLELPWASRQRRLADAYHFRCGCQRCEFEAEPQAAELAGDGETAAGGSPLVGGGSEGGWACWVEQAWAEAERLTQVWPPNSSAVGLFLLKTALKLQRKLPAAALSAGGGGKAMQNAVLAEAAAILAVSRGPRATCAGALVPLMSPSPSPRTVVGISPQGWSEDVSKGVQ